MQGRSSPIQNELLARTTSISPISACKKKIHGRSGTFRLEMGEVEMDALDAAR